MQNGYYQAVSGMVAQFNRLDAISNNLANINTSGFKRDDVAIGDFARVFKQTRDNLPLQNNTQSAAFYANSSLNSLPQISQGYTDFSAGSMKASANPLDLALVREDAFYLVQTKNGEIRLSKDGNFELNNEGFIVNKQGHKLLGSEYFNNPQNAGIQIPQNTRNISVDTNGNINADNDNVARIFIAQADDLRLLKKDGNNLFKLDDLTQLRDLENSGAIKQGFSQGSNVNPVSEMVALIEAQRMVEMYQKVMSSHMDDLNKEAIDKLASLN